MDNNFSEMSSQMNRNLSKRIKDIKLNSLLEITKAINHNHSTEQLLEIFENVIKTELNIGKLVLFSNENGWKCILKYGVGDEYNDINVENDLLPITEIGTTNFSQTTLNRTFEIVIPVFHKTEPLAYVLIGDGVLKSLRVSNRPNGCLPFVMAYETVGSDCKRIFFAKRFRNTPAM